MPKRGFSLSCFAFLLVSLLPTGRNGLALSKKARAHAAKVGGSRRGAICGRHDKSLTAVTAILAISCFFVSGCGSANTRSGSAGTSPNSSSAVCTGACQRLVNTQLNGVASPGNVPPSAYTVDVRNENVLQWKLNDDTSTTAVRGGSVLNRFAQNGTLVNGSSTAQVAATVNGFPGFHFTGQYVRIELSTIHPYETANLWTKAAVNPVITNQYPQDCEIVRNPNGSHPDWYCFGEANGSISRYESRDLIHWTGPTPVLSSGGTGAWDEQVQDGYAFQDPLNGGRWMLLYRGYNSASYYQVGLATSTDGTHFTRKDNGGVNDGLFPQFGGNYDALAVMLVGTTYYVYVNGSPGHGSTNVYSSTDDFKTFTADSNNPVFVNAFCPTVWKYGGYYYMLIARDLDRASAAPLSHGIALYRSRTPSFDPKTREYLGYAIVNDRSYDGHYLDTPSVPTTDIYRTTYPPEFGDVLYMLYAGVQANSSSLSFTQSIAFTSLSGLAALTPIPESTTEWFSLNTPVSYSFWIQFDSLTDSENVFRVGGGTPAGGSPTWYVSVQQRNLALYLQNSYGLASSPLSPNTPYQVTIVDNVSNKQVYINGVLEGTFTSPLVSPYPSPSYLYLGAGDGNSLLQGSMADFRVYPQGLNSTEVRDLFETGSIAAHISDITVSAGPSRAVISWQTDDPADSQVVYGTSPTYTASSNLNSVMSTMHSVTLKGLMPQTTYHFAVKSSNGTVSTSSDQTFTTAAIK